MTQQTRLQKIVEALGFQGGTVHQVNRALTRVRLGYKTDILELTDDQFSELLTNLEDGGWFYDRVKLAYALDAGV